MSEPEMVGCRDQCGAQGTPQEVQSWDWLPIQKRYRCPACSRALREVNARTKEVEVDRT